MYNYPGGYNFNYSSLFPSSQGYSSYAYSAPAPGYTVPVHTPFASQSVQQRSSPASSQASSSSSKPPKRPRSENMFKHPGIPTPIYSVATAHNSLEEPWDPEYGSSARFATIGRMLLPAVIADVLSMKKPLLDAEALKVCCLSTGCMNITLKSCSWPGRGREAFDTGHPCRMVYSVRITRTCKVHS